MINCKYVKKCGACSYLNMEYDKQLALKQKEVQALFPKQKIDQCIGMKNPYYYRHKVYASFYPVHRNEISCGLYVEGSHHRIPSLDCHIQNKQANRLLKTFVDLANEFHYTAYDEDRGNGILRHLYIRISHKTKEILLTIVIGSKFLPNAKAFIKALREKEPNIQTIILNYNHKHTSMVLGDKEDILYGKGYIYDEIDGVRFKISSRSFYQVNPIQTEKLYQLAIDYADLRKEDRVLDLCCGIGTISLLASRYCKEVIGVEVNHDAIYDARGNAKLNHQKNAKFYVDDANRFMQGFSDPIDVIFLDPPRSGVEASTMKYIEKLKPRSIVYVSCNPKTLVRDIKVLKHYKV
ncbi:MAG: 23S rRNA (uracil(1939)-C(5))-methyltransferase RlmD, partial [Solobacterium sp.]|nr:23S rRNA (uracil(1939)-C(5))-methyltransferase RlmD [Solobacterium sp.]